MLINEILAQNPIHLLSGEVAAAALQAGEVGVVIAKPGVGKTALLVQLALDSMLTSGAVIHASIGEPVSKVSIWYDEMLSHLAKRFDGVALGQLWAQNLNKRFIMTFKAERFSIAGLEERISDLASQNIFSAKVLLLDGMELNTDNMAALKELAKKLNLAIWVTATAEVDSDFAKDLTNAADRSMGLRHTGNYVEVLPFKGLKDGLSLHLDPQSMLVTNN